MGRTIALPYLTVVLNSEHVDYRRKQMRDTFLRAEKSSAGVDLVHEVVTLHGSLGCSRQVDGTGVVNQNINATEFLDTCGDGRIHHSLIADVHNAC